MTSHAERHQRVFATFCKAHQLIQNMITEVRYTSEAEEFPDVITQLADGTEVWWELGEWLNQDQMREARERERAEERIRTALKEVENQTQHISQCALRLRKLPEQLSESEAVKFVEEFRGLSRDADSRPELRHESRKVYSYPDIDSYPTLAQYVDRLWFWRRSDDPKESFPPQHWIRIHQPGGTYDPEDAIQALRKILQDKLNKYGGLIERDVRLIVHYGQAFSYNTPFESLAYLSFAEVAQAVAGALDALAKPFRKVYLLNEPEREAFEVYPIFSRCE